MAEDPKPEGVPSASSEPAPAQEGGTPKPPVPPAAAKPAAKPAAPPPPKPPAVMVTAPWDGEIPEQARAEFGEHILECVTYLGQPFIVCRAGAAVPLLELLKHRFGFDYLVDVTAVHWPKREQPFDLIYIVYSFPMNQRIRVKALLEGGAKPASAVPVHTTADWLEREVFDMFGIEFSGHPNMKRILLPDEWQGFPLRKDYGILQMDNQWVRENLGIESGQ